MQEYFVAEITKHGWHRISRNYKNVLQAQKLHSVMKTEFPNTCVLVDHNVKPVRNAKILKFDKDRRKS